jgi:acetolactate synthase-1/2/3 large subunit
MKIRVADYIATRLTEFGAKYVFLLSGGMMMHLTDALDRGVGLKYICSHHEQASSMAADGYARRSGEIGVCYATSGPGATNILTGLVGAWQESTPLIFLTGQVKSSQTIQGAGISDLRQFGTFEVDIVPIVKTVTKYAQLILDPSTIRFHLEKALHLATTGRPGPVLLDIPLDVQGAQIDPDDLVGYIPEYSEVELPMGSIDAVMTALSKSARPLILAGYGVRCANAVQQFQKLAERLDIPVATTQLGKDVLFYDHPLFVGHPGPKGDRAGNFAVQTADLIISIGCSLHSQTTGWENDLFAPNAVKIQVELDPAVLAREQVNVTQKIQVGCMEFINAMLAKPETTNDWAVWRKCCNSWKLRYPVYSEPHDINNSGINYYQFAESLSKVLPQNSSIVADAGSAFYVMGQALRLKDGQRFISSGSMGAMGFALPVANGVAVADKNSLTVCVTGDGSLMTNVHELATTRKNNLNVKIFVINNDGYVSMRNTQRDFCGEHYVGADGASGVFIPSIELLAQTYELPFVRCSNADDLASITENVLAMAGPVICEVVAMRDQKIIPTVASVKLADGRMQSCQIHNMTPLLSDEVMATELAIALAIPAMH